MNRVAPHPTRLSSVTRSFPRSVALFVWPAARFAVVLTAGATFVAPLPATAQRSAQAPPSRLEAIELGPAQTSATTLLARIGSPGSVRHFMLEDPWRIVVDIDGADHDLERSDYPDLRSGSLRGVRTSQFSPRTVRLVLDLSEKVGYSVRILNEGVRIDLDDVAAEPRRLGETDNLVRSPPATALPLVPEGPVLAVVTELAGSTLYVDAGTRQGLFDGDTLRVTDAGDGSTLGALTVLSSATAQALLAFAGRPFPITLGDTLGLDPPHIGRAVTAASRSAGGATSEGDTVGGLRTPGALPTDPAADGDDDQLAPFRLPPTVHGRIHFSMNAQSSSTHWGTGSAPLSRSFLTPTMRLRLEASDLPGDVTLKANVRGSYRHEATGLVEPAGSLRVYELSFEKRLAGAPLRLQAGRFFSPYEAFSGYYDGALVRVGSDGFGVGGAVGVEPDRWNEGFSTARPKRSAFIDFQAIGPGRGMTGEFAAVQVRPESGAEHLYFGWAGQAWVGGLNIAHTAQIDRDPTSGRWVVSDLLVQGGLPLVGPLRLRGSWSRRSPFYFWQTAAPVSYRRDDVGGGFSLDLPGGSIGGDATLHQADGDSAWTRSYAGSLRVHSIAGSRLGLHGLASFWDDRLLRMVNVSAGVNRSWGRGFGRLGYRMIDSRNAWFELLSHQAEALVDVPVQPGVRATVLGHARWGRGLRSYRVQIGFWRSF